MKTLNMKKAIEEMETQSLIVTKGFGYIHIADVIKILKDNIKEQHHEKTTIPL